MIRCYDWLIDRQPAQQGVAELGDVSGSVQISVQAETTLPAFEQAVVPVSSFNMSADGAGLAGVSGIYIDDVFPQGFGFVFQETLELPITPTAQEGVELPALFFLPLDLKLFQNKSVCYSFRYPLAQTVVDVSHKPSFSTAKTLKVSHSGRSAFALQPCFQPLVASFDSAEDSAVEELVVAGYDRIDNASVYAEDSFRGFLSRSFEFGDKVQDDVPTFHSECCGSDFTRSIFDVAFWDVDRDFDSTFERGQGDDIGLQEGSESIVVQSNRRNLFLNRESLQLLPLEHVAGLVTGSTDVTTVEFRIQPPNLLVGGVVEFGLVEGLTLETSFEGDVAGCVVEPYRLSDSLVKREFQVDCSPHSEYPLGFAI